MVESRNTTVREPPARPRDTQSPVGPSIISTTAVGAKSETVNVRGLFDLPEGGVVSSLALTPDGCYVFAGFGGGEIRLYAQALGTVGAASKAGTIVAQIRSKGMFINTKVECHVEASEDGRFVFAGLFRGSSEMIALDISDLPRWGTLPTREEARLLKAATRVDLNRRIRTYSHTDGKLKGFGASAVCKGSDRSQWSGEYRLFCGRGIKNIHVWSFKPSPGGELMAEPGVAAKGVLGSGGGQWTCLYDTHTNGATVELLAFRNGGLEGISKSTDANVRVWDLSDHEKHPKPTFRDISNSKDTRVVFGDYAYGGTTMLSLVKLDAPAAANRMEIGLPEGAAASPLPDRRSSPSARGKRHCRMLKDVAGTQDGRHVVLVCTDGTLFYHRHTHAVNTMKLQPLEGLGVGDEDTRPAVALSLTGRGGLPVLMIAGGHGGRGATRGGTDREAQKELELMALPCSGGQERDDAQNRGGSLARPWLGPWPKGRRLTSEDQTDWGDWEEEEENGGGDCDGSIGDNKNMSDVNDEDSDTMGLASNVRYDMMDVASEHRSEGTLRRSKSPGIEDNSEGRREAYPSVGQGEAVKAGGLRERKKTLSPRPTPPPLQPLPSTPVPRRPVNGEVAGWNHNRPNKCTNPSPTAASLSSSPLPLLFSTPASGGRKRARSVDSKSGGGGGTNPRARSPATFSTATPSPAFDSASKNRKKCASDGGRSVLNAEAAVGARPRMSPACSTGHDTPTSALTAAPVNGSAFTTPNVSSNGVGKPGWRMVGAPAKKDSNKQGGVNDVRIASIGDDVSMKTTVTNSEGDRGALGGLAAAAVALAEAATTRRGKVALDLDKELVEIPKSGEDRDLRAKQVSPEEDGDDNETVVAAKNRPIVVAAASVGLRGGDTPVASDGDALQGNRGAAEESGEKKRSVGAASGGGAGGGGKGAVMSSSSKRLGKKRAREDGGGPGAEDESAEEGKTSEQSATTQKRGRREEGGAARTLKPRRGSSGNSVDAGGAGSSGGGNAGGAGGGDQLLLRDRQSRLAARALRSSGNLFDAAVMSKGMAGAGWLAGAVHEPSEPELRVVVKAAERSGVIEPPPAVPSSLAAFLSTRQERRSREVIPVSIDQARAWYGRVMKQTPACVHIDSSGAQHPPGSASQQTRGAATPSAAAEADMVNSKATAVAVDSAAAHASAGGMELEESRSDAAELVLETRAHERLSSGASRGSAAVSAKDDTTTLVDERSAATASCTRPLGLGGRAPIGHDLRLSPAANGDGAYAEALRERDSKTTASMTSGSESGRANGAASGAGKGGSKSDEVTDAAAKNGDSGDVTATEIIAKEDGTCSSNAVAAKKKSVKEKDPRTEAEAKEQPKATAVPEAGDPSAGSPQNADGPPDVFPPPMEAVIDMRTEDSDGERGFGGGADRLYGIHCLEREVVARCFFREQDLLRRRFQAAVDVVELDRAVECSGLELRSGCRAVQSIKMRLKTRWKEGTMLPNAGGLSRCTTKEANQAEQKWQEQVRNVIADHQELLVELMGRQRLEAGALQMSQMMEVPRGGSAPLLQVRFGFPRMFEEVAQRHGISL